MSDGWASYVYERSCGPAALRQKQAIEDDVVVGATLWEVSSLGVRSEIIEYKVTSEKYVPDGLDNPFVDVTSVSANYDTSISLLDSGIILNGYNRHLTFTTLKAAKKYLAEELLPV